MGLRVGVDQARRSYHGLRADVVAGVFDGRLRVCPKCGGEFAAARRDQIYCSRACMNAACQRRYQRKYREKKKGAAS